jgi:DNA polymerase
MTKNDKELIFDLLKTCDSHIRGYTETSFLTKPDFCDDPVKESKVEREDLQAGQAVDQQPVQAADVQAVALETAPQTDSKKLTLSDLKAKIERCTRCSLARTRNNVVIGEGVENPKVLVVGEGPGEEEDLQGRPFVGRAGILLDKMLNAINLDRKSNCYIANVVKCRPPQNRNPFPDEQSACFGFLQTQIHLLKPQFILCMGKIAAEKLLDQKFSVNENHGNFYDYNGIPLMVTFHPSALLRNESLKRPAWEDLKKLKARLDSQN